MRRGVRILLIILLVLAVAAGAVWLPRPAAPPDDPSPQPPEQAKPAPQPDPVPAPEPAPAPEPEPQPELEPEPEPPAEPVPEAPPTFAEQAAALAQTMTLREQVYQLFVVTPESLTGVNTATIAGEATETALASQPVGGVIYFSKNLVNREQTMALLAGTQSFSKIPLLLAVDEEGGMVARAGSNPAMGTTAFPPMAELGAAGDLQAVCDAGKTMGTELLELGFNLDFAPVADVVTNPRNTEIGSRSFSSDPAAAARMVGSMVAGFRDVGILCTLKHFPGHGGTDADTHHGLAVTERTVEEMRGAEFLPFRAGIDAGAPMVMVGHLSAPAVNGDLTPASLSKAVVTGLLREELGFSGVIVTDALNMGAVTDGHTPAEAAVAALKAGADLLLMPDDLTGAAEGILAAVETGQLTEARILESVTRILTMKYEYGILS